MGTAFLENTANYIGGAILMVAQQASSHSLSPNMALNLAPFGRWTLRDKAAQRRLAPRS